MFLIPDAKNEVAAFVISIGLHVFALMLFIVWPVDRPQKSITPPSPEDFRGIELFVEHMQTLTEATGTKQSIPTPGLDQEAKASDLSTSFFEQQPLLEAPQEVSGDVTMDTPIADVETQIEPVPERLFDFIAVEPEIANSAVSVEGSAVAAIEGIDPLPEDAPVEETNPEMAARNITESKFTNYAVQDIVRPISIPLPKPPREVSETDALLSTKNESPPDLLSRPEMANNRKVEPRTLRQPAEENRPVPVAYPEDATPDLLLAEDKAESPPETPDAIVSIDSGADLIQASDRGDMVSEDTSPTKMSADIATADDASHDGPDDVENLAANSVYATAELAKFLPGVFAKPAFTNHEKSHARSQGHPINAPRAPAPLQGTNSNDSCQQIARMPPNMLEELKQWHSHNITSGATIEMLLRSNRFSSVSGNTTSISQLLSQQHASNAMIANNTNLTVGHILARYLNGSISLCQR